MEEKKLIKRTTVYLQQPMMYGLSGCQCGNENTQWSEYEKHLWCDKCNIDFEPEEKGVFGHPVGVKTTSLLGLFFHRLNLETNEVEAFITEGYYIKAINFYLQFSFTEKVEVLLPQSNKVKLKALLNLNDFTLHLKNGVDPKNNNQNFDLIVFTISTDKQFQEWKLPVIMKNKQLQFLQDDNFILFKNYILKQKLEWKLPEVNKVKPNKI